MDKRNAKKNWIRLIFEGRAARACVVAVSVFLCMLTLVEFTALYMEWEIPALKVITGEDTGWFGDSGAEQALDTSKDNVPLGGTVSGTETPPGEEAISETETSLEEMASNPYAAKKDDENSLINESETETQSTEEEMLKVPDVEYPYLIRVNRKENCITIYIPGDAGEYTVPYKAMICSTGLYNATPRGTYHLSDKYLWRELYGGVYGQYATRITGGVLFHSVPYYKKAKNALCTEKYNKLGQQASMGCIRLTVADAKWIAENCPKGTAVEIYDDEEAGPLGKPQAAKIDTQDLNNGWDPTDPDTDNPWHEELESRFTQISQ